MTARTTWRSVGAEMDTPAELAASIERSDLPTADGELFAGYGIMAQPFRSGHVLAVRRFPYTTLGAAYTSVWHCDPAGRWTTWNTAPPLQSCPRYLGPAIAAAHQCAIDIEWPDRWTLHVRIDGVLDWQTSIVATPATRTMTAICRLLPEGLWRNHAMLAVMGRMGGPFMRAGAIRLAGRLPSRQSFEIKIRRVWAVADVSARLGGESLGPAGPSHPQRWLGDFALPNRALFAIGRLAIEHYEPARHLQTLPDAA